MCTQELQGLLCVIISLAFRGPGQLEPRNTNPGYLGEQRLDGCRLFGTAAPLPLVVYTHVGSCVGCNRATVTLLHPVMFSEFLDIEPKSLNQDFGVSDVSRS